MLLSLMILVGCGEKEDDTTSEPSSETAEPSGEPSGEPSSEVVDEDEDGVVASDDCDDTDPDLGAIALDADCDGVLTEDDCNDNDATFLAQTDDEDCDGVLATDDCDDTDSNLLSTAEDQDCDGIITSDDCDDANDTMPNDDGDCDGVLTVEDCDDSDPSSVLDMDCDGVATEDDCDDGNAGSTIRVFDTDCDGISEASMLSVGKNHSCVLDASGEISCWGDNTLGQTEAPVGMFTTFSSGWNHNCAIDTNNSIICWGDDANGQATAGSGAYTSIDAGAYHSCAIQTDGSIDCWGDDFYGQSSPTASNGDLITTGETHSCSVNHGPSCWGNDDVGQVSSAVWSNAQTMMIDAGIDFTCTLNQVNDDPQIAYDYGSISCWGEDTSGQSTPPSGFFSKLSVGAYHACAIAELGNIECWGNNSQGQASPPAGNFLDVAAGEAHTCAVDFSGNIECWGDNSFLQTDAPISIELPNFPFYPDEDGDGYLAYQDCDDTDASSTNRLEDYDCDGVLSVDDCDDTDSTLLNRADDEDCDRVLTADDCNDTDSTMPNDDADCDGTLTEDDCDDGDSSSTIIADDADCDGVLTADDCDDNDISLLSTTGDGDCDGLETAYDCDDADAFSSNVFLDADCDGFVDQNVMSGDYEYFCSLNEHGLMECNGDTSYWFYISNWNPPYDYYEFDIDLSESSEDSFKQISVVQSWGCGITQADSISCWGNDIQEYTYPPTSLGRITNIPAGSFKSLSISEYRACAVDTSGGLECWPNATSLTGTFEQVDVGSGICAITSSGAVQCEGSQIETTPPGSNFEQVSVGYSYACALDSNGDATCWGEDGYGQATPVSGPFIQISTNYGYYPHTCGLRPTGEIECWGNNDYGHLNVPTLSEGHYVSVETGTTQTCGLTSVGDMVCWGGIEITNWGSDLFASETTENRYPYPIQDFDGDGYLSYQDCDDSNSNSVLVADDLDCDGSLNADDCNDLDSSSTIVAEDADCDGAISVDDCNDSDALIYPGAPELCDGVDNDCDGYLTIEEEDYDGDGFITCVMGSRWLGSAVSPGIDCDDWDAFYTPVDTDADGMSTCDGDCDDTDVTLNTDDLDADGFSTCDGDCDDTDDTEYPSLTWYADTDGDGFGDINDWSDCERNDASDVLNSDDCDPLFYDPISMAIDPDCDGEQEHPVFSNNCAIDHEGRIQCWGLNNQGWATSIPGGTTYNRIYSGSGDYCAITESGSLRCWGSNASSAPTSGTFYNVFVDQATFCSHDNSSGTLYCWGYNNNTDGLGSSNEVVAVGQMVGNSYCSLLSSGSLDCPNLPSFTLPSNTQNNFVDLKCNYDDCYAFSDTGVIHRFGLGVSSYTLPGVYTDYVVSFGFAVGLNTSGQVMQVSGYGASAPANTLISGSFNSLHSTGNSGPICALDFQGSPHCWQQYSDSFGIVANAPSNDSFVDLYMTPSYEVCGLRANGSVYCWGSDSNYVVSNTPTTTGFEELLPTSNGICGRFADGTLECWGNIPSDFPTSITLLGYAN